MSLGVHFALSPQLQKQLESAPDQEELRGVLDDLEDVWDEELLQETDRAWDAISRCLGKEPPLSWATLGGLELSKDPQFIARLIKPEQVVALVPALDAITEEDFGARFEKLKGTDYAGEGTDEDREYSWDWFLELREFFRFAAEEKLGAVFTVDF
jgi:hypothetical protein